MKENERRGSILTILLTTIALFLTLALFDKSVHSSQLPTPKHTETSTFSLKPLNGSTIIPAGYVRLIHYKSW